MQGLRRLAVGGARQLAYPRMVGGRSAMAPYVQRAYMPVAHHQYVRPMASGLGNPVEKVQEQVGKVQDAFAEEKKERESILGSSTSKPKFKLGYDWVDKEAQVLIARAYNRHKALADKSQSYPPALGVEDLEKIVPPNLHRKPEGLLDHIALGTMRLLRVFTNAFFGDKYLHHATLLETVAAVPGIIASASRHLRSLRRMKRDHSWIGTLQEESENERMHLLIWLAINQPNMFERMLVIFAQGAYFSFYSLSYLFSPRFAHRLVGYLEEEAVIAYTEFLHSIDAGKMPNIPAPEIAIEYYRLAPDAKLRDVVLHVRADEIMHQMVNHHLSDKYKHKDLDSKPTFVGQDYREGQW
ncbi:Ubiquinol oxidase, mitochondrial [Porphyridium purpureum]|uniref:Ubiquinol oxidase, mitochondrial n=1 Tax=Porphyridium purpureum TaxID=35688 RepID=A0A5J4YRE2_PORPP|nr:Ubiquinol oxidase, mitochondrial [Porphyridium purpureum]|eukprot:POR9056..scf236_6